MTTRRRKTTKLKRRKGAAALRRRGSSAADLQKQLDQRTRQLAVAQKRLAEALEQQTAMSEVLGVISSSPTELQPVFETIVKNAARLCNSVLSAVYRSDGERVHLVAHDQFSAESVAAVQKAYPALLTSGNLIAVSVRERRVVHVADVLVSGGYSELQRTSGYRSILVVPMMREDTAIGAIAVMQLEPRLFPKSQVELVQNFAAQAVIAIENTQLLNELRESLQQQTAMADVLKTISSSPGELQPVFDALLENATRICEAKLGNLFLREGNDFRAVAVHGESGYADWYRCDPMVVMRTQPRSPLDRVIKTSQTYLKFSRRARCVRACASGIRG